VKRKIELERINTDNAAEKFARMLDEKRENFFLNGSWGSGKTEFLRNVEKYSKKKFINLNLWDMKDDRNIITIAYSKLHPIVYWGTLISAIITIPTVVLFLPKIVEGFCNLLSGEEKVDIIGYIVKTIAFVVAVIFTIWRTGGFKKEVFYYATMKWWLKGKKILVVDDFDRVDYKDKEEAYKLFNLLRGKIIIIFLGDIIKIVEEKEEQGKKGENFLQKIIDTKVELPFVLHSSSVWHEYFSKLTETFQDSSNFDELKRIFISERRNLRDREQFNKLVNREFFERNKYEHVQTYQQLLVIYAYLFYHDIYVKLLCNEDVETSKKYKEFIDSDYRVKEIGFLGEKTFNDLVYDMQKDRHNEYPKLFAQDRQAYYLYEEVNNLTAKEILDIINDPNKLRKNLLMKRDNDFYQYMLTNYSKLSVDHKYQLLGFSLYFIKENYSTPVLEHIINKTTEKITTDFIKSRSFEGVDIESERDRYNYRYWYTILKSKGFDISQILYFLESFRIVNLGEVVESTETIDLENYSNYAEMKRKDYCVLYYLRKKEYFDKYEKWTDIVWRRINDMSNVEWLSFWIYMNEIHPVDPLPAETNKAFPNARKYVFGRVNPTKSDPPRVLVENITMRKDRLRKAGYILVIDEK